MLSIPYTQLSSSDAEFSGFWFILCPFSPLCYFRTETMSFWMMLFIFSEFDFKLTVLYCLLYLMIALALAWGPHIFRVFLKDFEFLCKIPWPFNMNVFAPFRSSLGWSVFFLVLTSAVFVRVGRWCGFSYHIIPTVTRTVGILPGVF